MNDSILLKIYPKKNLKTIEEKIKYLGNDTKYTVSSFCTIRLILSFLAFIIVITMFNHGYIIAPFALVGVYYLFYYLNIYRKLNIKIKRLDFQALEFFEILTLTLESGRNLEQSLQVTCDNIDSELSDEFKKALLEIKFGKSLTESLNDVKKRIPSQTINNIILNITQTSQFGSQILETMYNQVDFLREKKILDIKGQINKIPNKVSIVSVLFVVPLIMMLILGPYLIDFLG